MRSEQGKRGQGRQDSVGARPRYARMSQSSRQRGACRAAVCGGPLRRGGTGQSPPGLISVFVTADRPLLAL